MKNNINSKDYIKFLVKFFRYLKDYLIIYLEQMFLKNLPINLALLKP